MLDLAALTELLTYRGSRPVIGWALFKAPKGEVPQAYLSLSEGHSTEGSVQGMPLMACWAASQVFPSFLRTTHKPFLQPAARNTWHRSQASYSQP